MDCGKREHPTLGDGDTGTAEHPSVEGRQHAARPHRRFGPGPPGPDLARVRSPFGHSRGEGVRRRIHHTSTFLHPFARRALPRVTATMGALTPGRLSAIAQVSLLHVHGRSDHSVSNHPVPRRLGCRGASRPVAGTRGDPAASGRMETARRILRVPAGRLRCCRMGVSRPGACQAKARLTWVSPAGRIRGSPRCS